MSTQIEMYRHDCPESDDYDGDPWVHGEKCPNCGLRIGIDLSGTTTQLEENNELL